jgi:NAD(P)-dependent dehydrogenase (short-subunit alcohol dehydrogenase family)
MEEITMKTIPADYQPAADLLRDRTILVTGAGDGIGAVAARTFAAHGATVVLLGKTVPKLEAVYDAIETAGHPQPAIYPLDLEGASYEHYEQLAATLDKEFGRLDGLLHNAAILGARMMIEQYDLKLWARVMHVNLTAPFLLSRACLPVMRRSADASMLFTSTGVAHHGKAYWGAYGVSKAGADNLMQIIADEMETNTHIRANSIDPGVVATRMRRLAFPAEDASTLPTPESVMPAYLYLMGPDSKGCTGEIFGVSL